MTEPMPEPQGQRQAIPPRRPVAVGLLEPEQPIPPGRPTIAAPGHPHRAFPWRLAMIAAVGLFLLLAVAIWRLAAS